MGAAVALAVGLAAAFCRVRARGQALRRSPLAGLVFAGVLVFLIREFGATDREKFAKVRRLKRRKS